MDITIDQIVQDFAVAFKAVDVTGPQDRKKKYHPGVGPLAEADAVKLAMDYLKLNTPELYAMAAPVRYPGSSQQCDLVIPQHWAIEFKLLRPYGDNGKEAEHWSENILHPYPGNTSCIGDCLKLKQSAFEERKGIIVFAYEHTPPRLDLEIAIRAFEIIAAQVTGIQLSNRSSADSSGLMHPHHQQVRVFGWHILD